MNIALERDLSAFVEDRTDRLVGIVRDLVRLPSENRAPLGSELACQEYAAARLRRAGWEPSVYTPLEAPGIEEHPMYWPGRQYAGRPNVAAVRKGAGGGRSLMLSGHMDTVPAGSAAWSRAPFGGEVEGNRLYGRGAVDMKAGIASNLFVVESLAELGIELAGDLTFESVVDEEFGGVNGTLAGRLMGFHADAAVLSEPTSNRVCPAQRGGRTVQIRFAAPNGGILAPVRGADVTEQLRLFLNALPAFVQLRRMAAPAHPLYAHLEEPVPVTLARVHTAPWGTSEPPNVPPICQVELFWQAMPGETVETIDRDFDVWLSSLVRANPANFAVPPVVTHPIRWLPGSALPASDPLVAQFAETVTTVLGKTPKVCGIEGPCDMYVFHEFGIPALLWGPGGGNVHMSDEYLEIDSLVASTKALLAFVCQWCGVATR